MFHLLDETEYLVAGATERAVVVVLKTDGEPALGRLIAHLADSRDGAAEGRLARGLARRRAGKDTQQGRSEKLRGLYRRARLAKLLRVALLGPAEVGRDCKHRHREAVIEVSPADPLEVARLGARQVL